MGLFVGSVCVTMYTAAPEVEAFEHKLNSVGVRTFRHYKIPGYPTKKSAFTGSAKMIHTEQITKRPVTNVIESLSGQVAGLQMTMTNGQPGETPSILIRGISSMSAKTDPLIVLDGIIYGYDLRTIL